MPVPSWVGPTVRAGTTLGSTLLAGRQRPEEKAAVTSLQQGITAGGEASKQLMPIGTNLLTKGAQTYQPALDYWRGILSGDRGAAFSAAAPEISRIAEGYEGTRQAQANLVPRGGGRSSLLSQLPYQQMRDQQTLLQQARPEAAKNVMAAGTQIAQTGSTAINSAIQALYGTTSAGRELLDYAQTKKAGDIEEGRTIGKSILDIASGIAPSIFLGGGGGAAAGAAGGAAAGGAAAGGAAAGGAAAEGGAAAGGGAGIGSTIAALASNPVTWVVGGALVGGLIWRKSQGHWKANDWVQNFQNPFDQSMAQINQFQQAGSLSPEAANKARQDLLSGYKSAMNEFAKKGGDHATVIKQAQETLRKQYGYA